MSTSRSARSGTCSRRSAASWSSIAVPSTASTRVPASVSKTCTVRFDNNKYSVLSTAVGRPGRDPGLCRSHRHPPGRRRRGRACPLVRPRRDGLRSLALRPGAGAQARRAAQRRAVPGLGSAVGDGAGPAQAEGCRRRRPADGVDPDRGADRRARCRRGRLPGGARPERLLVRRHHQHPGPAARSGAGRHHPHPDALRLRHEPQADCARYDSLRRAS